MYNSYERKVTEAIGLSFKCPKTLSNPCTCPLYTLRKLPEEERLKKWNECLKKN
jgi:hypothetical protein